MYPGCGMGRAGLGLTKEEMGGRSVFHCHCRRCRWNGFALSVGGISFTTRDTFDEIDDHIIGAGWVFSFITIPLRERETESRQSSCIGKRRRRRKKIHRDYLFPSLSGG